MAQPAPAAEAEVCIVGAGPAGSLIAAELARRSIQVVVIESGPRHDFAQRPAYVRRFLRGENPWQTTLPGLDRFTTAGGLAFPLTGGRVRGVGGGTLYWEGYAIRFHADDFRLRSRHGIADDWPVSYQELEPYYVEAERALGVAGAADDPWASPRSAAFPLPPFPFSDSDGLFAEACRTAGITLHHLPQARNSVPYGGRSACLACGTCHVCPTGAKASVDLTHLPDAERTGYARILPDSTALRLETDRAREVSAVVYAGADRRERRVSARRFVVAAGAVETARLLLLSASPSFPDGLANRSGLVGQYFMSHPSVQVTGRVRRHTGPYRTGFSSAMSRQFAVERDRVRQGAFFFEFLNSAGPTPAGIALASGLAGEALRARVREGFGHTLGIRVYGEQLPDRANTVSLDRGVTDYFGNPVPRLTYDLGRYERLALEDATAIARRIFEAAGASAVEASGVRFAAHQIGTHRMGDDPRSSVVDARLRAHDVPNLYLVGSGAFVTASPSPPTLTIAALALRAARHIAAELRPGGAPGAESAGRPSPLARARA